MNTYLDSIFKSIEQLAEKIDRQLNQASTPALNPPAIKPLPPAIPYEPIPTPGLINLVVPQHNIHHTEVQKVSSNITTVRQQVCVTHQSTEVTIQRAGISIKQAYSETHIRTMSQMEVIDVNQVVILHGQGINELPF